MDNPRMIITDKGIVENVKMVNHNVELAKKYLKEHSKEVYEINFHPVDCGEGHLKFEIYFNPNDSQLKEAQKQIDAKQSQPTVSEKDNV